MTAAERTASTEAAGVVRTVTGGVVRTVTAVSAEQVVLSVAAAES